jgi:hypothetical protein
MQPQARVETLKERPHLTGFDAEWEPQITLERPRSENLQVLAESMVIYCHAVVVKQLSLPNEKAKECGGALKASPLSERPMPAATAGHPSDAKFDSTGPYERERHGAKLVQPEEVRHQHHAWNPNSAVVYAMDEVLPVKSTQRRFELALRHALLE